MKQLFMHTERGKRAWNTGSASFRLYHKIDSSPVTVAVRCRIERLGSDLAFLDTGAEWTMIGGDTATLLEKYLGPPLRSLTVSTRLGTVLGELHRVSITLLTDPGRGDDLTLETTAFVSEEWEGPAVLGYRGFLERIRFALDPGIVPGGQVFYFGMAG